MDVPTEGSLGLVGGGLSEVVYPRVWPWPEAVTFPSATRHNFHPQRGGLSRAA